MATGLNIKRNSRIFHIANECYIIYLGIKTDEEKPFLRIGNMEFIDDKILDVISNTVLPVRYTGNPLYELKIDKARGINYIGDTAVIERMKTYLDSFQLPSNGAMDYHSVKDGEQRDVIYFYNNGNIKLNYKAEPIFDLYKRAESDLHFVTQCDEIKKSFSRNPLRYTKHDFRESGILLSGESLLVFNQGQFFSASLGRDYFPKLAAAGVDPDQIGVHYSRIKGGDEGDDASFALMEMLKRSSFRNTSFRVHAKFPEYTRKIGALFPGVEVSESGEEWSSIFSGLKVRDLSNGLDIDCSGFPMNLFVGEASAISDHMTLNIGIKTLTIEENEKKFDIEIPDGILCVIKKNPTDISDMTDKYISRFIPLIKGFSSENDYMIALAVQKLLKMLADVVDGKAKSGLIMRSSVFNFTDMLKTLHLKNDSILTYFLENALTILDLSLSRTDMDGKLVKNITSVQNDIKSILNKSDKANPLLPVAADIYTKEFPALLYRSVKSTAKKADYLLASQVSEDILGEHDLSIKYYDAEKIRLFKLIDMLNSATDLEVDKMLEKNKPAEPYRARKTEVIDSRGTRNESALEGSEQSGKGKNGLKSVNHYRKKRMPLWLLLLLIPLVLLALWGGYKGSVYFSGSNEENLLVSEDKPSTPSPPSTGSGTNRTVTDGTVTDGTVTDGTVTDGTVTDGTGTDGIVTDGTVTNGSVSLSGNDTSQEEENNTGKNNLNLNIKEVDAETENREYQPEEIVMKTENRPSTAEEAEAYLNVGDYYISAIDIHLASNQIAVDNNYRDLDFEVYDGADPDWIYPGSDIILPDKTIHNVISGDTIWYLAARFIRTTLDRDIPIYEKNLEPVKNGNSEARAILEGLQEQTPCEAFREKILEVLKN